MLTPYRQESCTWDDALDAPDSAQEAGCVFELPLIEYGYLQDHVKREAQIMMECDFPFLVNLVASFKDAERVYLLLECVMGGEFFTYLQAGPAI